METTLRDLKLAVRQARKSPATTVAAIAALALGIGVNTTVFSIVNMVLLRPLPYLEADRLVFIGERRSDDSSYVSVAYPNFLDWCDQSRSFAKLAAVRGQTYALTGDGQAERLMGAHASAGLFSTLGVQAALGRTLVAGDDRPGAPPVVVLSHGLWQRRFGGDPAIIGRTLTANDQSYEIVGVLPQSFSWFLHDQAPELWTPIGLWADSPWLAGRDSRSGIQVIARLRNGVSLAQAEADLAAIASRLAKQYPLTNSGISVSTRLLQDRVVSGCRAQLMILLGAVGLVLLIACVNVAHLLLARSTGRQREIAVRIALGAGRLRLVRQLLTESMVLGVGGGLGGLASAYAGTALVVAWSPAGLPRIGAAGIDAAVALFTGAIAILCTLLFGLAPALQLTRPSLSEALKPSCRGSIGTHRRTGSALVVVHTTLAVVPLICATLLIRSLWMLQAESPGFDPEGILTAQLVLSGSEYRDEESRRVFHRLLVERLASLPGVEAASTVNPLPVTGTGWQTRFLIEGRPRPDPADLPAAEWMQVSPGYFQTLEIPLLQGRSFTENDREDARQVVIIDQTFAERHFPGESPLGRRIAYYSREDPVWREIVGVVGHVKLNGVAESADTELYVPYAQGAYLPITMVVRTGGDTAALAPALSRVVARLDPKLPVFNVRTMEQLLANTLATRRLTTALLAGFAGLALALAASGVYGITSFAVSARTREIGIRIAIGARRSNVLSLVIVEGMVLVTCGLALGVPASYAVARLMAGLLFGVGPADALTFAIMPIALALVALLAISFPAHRATRIEPVAALRHE